MREKSPNPIASKENIVVHGNARFTFLTPKLLRMEWDQDGNFEDRATLAVINRKMPVVEFTTQTKGQEIVLKTKALLVRYSEDGKQFSKANLEIRFHHAGSDEVWHPGKKNTRNLKGTLRTLDGMDGDLRVPWSAVDSKGNIDKSKIHKVDLPDGFLSRSGWSVFDDSGSVILDRQPDGRRWVTARAGAYDLYFAAYGNDYKACLSDVSRILGRQVLPPKYALGYWYCRYWAYTDVEVEEIVTQFDTSGIPLDVFIIDMDWHLPGWTGYTWDKRFFPAPERLLAWLHERNLKVALNLHPADGVSPKEEAYESVCRDLEIDPAKGDTIPFNCADPKYIDAYFRRLHHPKEEIGVDFWWIDWQQGEDTQMPGLDPLPWLNQLHWEDQENRRPKRRPINFSRYGGPGAGRYPIGFSGDTYITWDSLKYQVYFTPTASNALYGYWSHDIGGHMGGAFTPEMYVRWMQFGAYSPVLRTHSSKSQDNDRRPWTFDEPFDRMILDAINMRYELIPYIYTEMHTGMETGVSLTRPMYYEYPEEEEAYTAKYQYYFGSSFVVSPIVKPTDPMTEVVSHKTWLPEGQWIDAALGRTVEGGGWYKASYLLSEIPVFVRPGTIVPGQFDVKRTGEGSTRNLLISAYPGGNGEYILYEDDGSTTDYLKEVSAFIRMTNSVAGEQQSIRLEPVNGRYKGMAKKRKLRVYVPVSAPPRDVTIDSKTGGWSYDAFNEQILIDVATYNIEHGLLVTVTHDAEARLHRVSGYRGLAARLKRLCTVNGMAVPIHSISENERIGVEVGQAYHRIDLDPSTYAAEMTRLKSVLPSLHREFDALVEPMGEIGHFGDVDLVIKAREMAKAIANIYMQI